MGCFAYADDIAIIAPSKKGIDVMIKVCEEFAVDRDMNFNGKKSTFMIFKGRHCVKARDNITIGGVNLQDVDETVYLGFKLQAGDSYNIILPDIAQFWRSVNIFFRIFDIFILLYSVNYLYNTVLVYMVPLCGDYREMSVVRYVLAGGKR